MQPVVGDGAERLDRGPAGNHQAGGHVHDVLAVPLEHARVVPGCQRAELPEAQARVLRVGPPALLHGEAGHRVAGLRLVIGKARQSGDHNQKYVLNKACHDRDIRNSDA